MIIALNSSDRLENIGSELSWIFKFKEIETNRQSDSTKQNTQKRGSIATI